LARLALGLPLALAAPTGCQHKSLLTDPHVRHDVSADAGYETLVLQAGSWQKTEPPTPGTPQGDLHIAEALFQAEDYKRAAKAFEEVADKHKNNTEVHEKALFMKAESEYQQRNYVKARDSFEQLIKTYPGSPHLAQASQRVFDIANYWLEDARRDVRKGHAASFPRRFFQFEPDRKPLFDIDGHAIQSLEYERNHDPNGPLADDSLMMTAGYHYTMGDYREADLFYDQLIHNYPRSEFQPQAHLLSAESKLHSYKGSQYDGRKMEEARRTFQAALSQYPQELEPDRQRIYRELDEIRNEQAKSQFEIGEWYRRMGRPPAARIYYLWVQKNFSGTKWGDRALERLNQLDQSGPTAAEATGRAEQSQLHEHASTSPLKTVLGSISSKVRGRTDSSLGSESKGLSEP
jgi:outer membrane assembly lipoprotein YfiO